MPLSRFGVDWWFAASVQNPDPVAFVTVDDKFAWCNVAWCKLLGYSVEELRRKRWQEVTALEDVAADQAGMDDLKEHGTTEYYLEKEYIRKDGTHVNIALYVHKHPEYGEEHKGYIVFARELDSVTGIAALRADFERLGQAVVSMQTQAARVKEVQDELQELRDKNTRNEAVIHAMLNGKGNNVNIGGDVTGRDKTNVPKNAQMWLILTVLALGVMAMGGKLYLDGGGDNPNLQVGPGHTATQE